MDHRTTAPFRLRRVRPIALLVLLAALAGCGGNGSGLINPVGRSGSIVVTIRRGAQPEFSWEDAAAVQAIAVYDFGPTGTVSRVLWGYANVSVKPPVRFGATITGGTNLGGGGAPTLVTGARYRVEVVRGAAASYSDWIQP